MKTKMLKILALVLAMIMVIGTLSACDEGTLGLVGAQGDQGIQGEKGDKGDPGKDGTSLLTGNGAPAADRGIVGDSYIDLDSWDFYTKTQEGWSLVGNIKCADDKDTPDDVLNGEYGFHHIVVEKILSGEKSTYNIGDTYLGLVMSNSTISVILNNGSGTLTYDFGSVITTNITYEVVNDKFIMTCENPVDILYGHPENRYEMVIDEIDDKVCFVLTVSSAYSIYTYYVVALP